MFRFTYTLPTGWPLVAFRPSLLGRFTITSTLFAAILLLPQFVTGQCTTMICLQNVNLSLGNDCTGSVNPSNIIQNTWTCQGPMTMTYYNAAGVSIGNMVTGDYLGQTLQVHVKHNFTGATCWGSVFIKDGKKPVITVANETLNCTEDPSFTALAQPTVTDNCSPASQITFSHQDTVLDFGCGYTGFAGYFAPNNWDICYASNGDGGVDVTGAPNSVLVEGANSSSSISTPSYVTKFKIVIPAVGYVTFDWSSVGGSSFTTEAFYFTINNWCIRLSSDQVQSGTYTSALLQPGDVLSFEQASNGGANANNTTISNFHFTTLAWKVIQRKWSATDAYGNVGTKVQTITLNRATLAQIRFPANRDGVAAPMLACSANSTDPNITGRPFIDEDGNLNTTADQYSVENGECFFNLSFTDQSIPTCQGSEVILRKWVVLDNCTNNFVEHTQIIKLFDVTPPVITCPTNMTVSTDDFGCFGIINLPLATAVDDCASQVTITPIWSFGSGYGPFNNVSQGTHLVKYTATDACGNTNFCNVNITVVDQVAPTVICQQFTVASVSSTGEATVYANLLDAGSYDHCCIESYEVKRAGQPNSTFAPSLLFSCADLNSSSVLVTLRVKDCHGNSNTCDVTVNVHDELPPVIIPPTDVVVDCNTDLGNLDVFGNATVTDNCSFILTETATTDMTNCGQGTVTRRFMATDPSGNTSIAQQVIHLVNQTPWNAAGNQIIWPQHYQTQSCTGQSLEPFDLPYPYTGPTLLGQNGCEAVAVAFEDEIFWISEPACYKIQRTWTILDWCQYQTNSNSNVGRWQHVQFIEVFDNQAPAFVNPPTNVMASSTTGCNGNVILPLPQVSDCSNHVSIVATGALGTGFSFQNVPAGIYSMTYTAADGCGNTSTHSFTVSVGDTGTPTAYCQNGLIVTLDVQGEVSVAAQQLNANSFDNCAPASSLQFSFSQNVADNILLFDCGDVGTNPVQLWVTDPGGNADYCETFVTVQDNPTPACNGGAYIDLGGMIQTPSGVPIANVTVNLSGANMPSVTTEAGVGTYSFAGLTDGGDYTITPSKNFGFTNGVSSFDLAKINEHILGVNEFTEAWRTIAADANGSGSVTAMDLVAVQAIILGASTSFPNGTPSWRFVPANHAFSSPTNPWPFPESVSMNNVTVDDLDIQFTGIKIGDVSGSVNPAYIVAPNGTSSSAGGSLQSVTEGRGNSGYFTIMAKDILLRKGESYQVEFEMEAAKAWQLTLAINSQLVELQGIAKAENLKHNTSRSKEGLVSMLSFGKNPATKFVLNLRALADTHLSEVIEISDEMTAAAAWNEAEEQLQVELAFRQVDVSSTNELSLSCQPNPFAGEAMVRFNMPKSGEAKFSFFDATGKMLHRTSGLFEKGQHSISIHSSELDVSGLVFLKMETGGTVRQLKLVVME
ncbi:MAG: HYR domain-containing protein [Saprospiraceae bacterium]|nr:HYR domain-containing protein [Saprospiraceae bacterium]